MSNGKSFLLIAGLAIAAAAAAQEPAEPSAEQAAAMAAFQAAMTPGPEHEWLAGLTGDYVARVRTWTDPGADPEVSESAVERSMELGGRVLREVWTGTVMGMPFTGIGRTGYDKVTDRYWTTWTDNLSTGLFIAYGQRNPETGELVFRGEMPDPMTGAMLATRSVARHEDGVEHMLMYQGEGEDEWRSMEFEIRAKE